MAAMIKAAQMNKNTFFKIEVALNVSRTFLISPNSPTKNTSAAMCNAIRRLSIKVAANTQIYDIRRTDEGKTPAANQPIIIRRI